MFLFQLKILSLISTSEKILKNSKIISSFLVVFGCNN